MARQIWTPEHDAELSERHSTETIARIAKTMGFHYDTVMKRAHRLGLRKPHGNRYNKTAREAIAANYRDRSHSELAKMTGLCERTVWRITGELGLRREPCETAAIRSRVMKEIYQAERRRANWGLPQKTGFKVFASKKKQALRSKLLSLGYEVDERGGSVFYYTDDLVRRPRREENGRKLGFSFEPLPDENEEETEQLPASPATREGGLETFFDDAED